MKSSPLEPNQSASDRISAYISDLRGWKGAILAQLRSLIRAACPELREEWKWGIPVWSNRGNVVAAAAFADHVKLNFFKGASIEDPEGLFNTGLNAKATRAIDFREGDEIPGEALSDLVRRAAEASHG